MKNYDVCIFDLDGTLVNSLADLANCTNEALYLHDLPTHSYKAYKQFVGNGIKNLIIKAMGDKYENAELFTSVSKAFNMLYNEKCMEETLPYPGVTELVDNLKDQGVKVCVLSNKADDFAKRIVSGLFAENTFDICIGKKPDCPAKPDPSAVFEILDELNCPKSRCLYIGDSNVDMQTAQNAGVDSCGVEWGFRSLEELNDAGAMTTVKHAKDIFQLVIVNE